MQKLTHLFRDKNPEDLHYFYGGNCFQHAMGYRETIMGLEKVADIISLNYVTLAPGQNVEELMTAGSLDEFNSALIKACDQEGIENLGGNFRQCEGYRTLAVFSGTVPGGRNDYHFAFLNDEGQWEYKVPFQDVKTMPNTKAIEDTTMYRLQFYGLVKDGQKPSMLQGLDIEHLDIGTPQKPCAVSVIKIGPNTPPLPINKNTVLRDVDVMATHMKQMFRAPKITPKMVDMAFDLLPPEMGIDLI